MSLRREVAGLPPIAMGTDAPPIFFLEKKTGRARSKRKPLAGQDSLDA